MILGISRSSRLATFLAFLTVAQFAGWGLSQTTRPGGSEDTIDQKNAALQSKVDAMQQQMDTLKQQLSEVRTAEHQDQPRNVDQMSEESWLGGYAKGFYLQDSDQFKLVANGLLDARYSFVHAENHSGLTNTPLGNNGVGDMSGFNLNTAQIALSGTLFHNIIFKVMGNFGSTASFTSPTAGTFQLSEYWGGYSFSPGLNFRIGSFIIPYVPIRTLANYGGSEFPDLSDITAPFLAGYGLGADVFGALANQTVSYDVMVGNGSNSQNLVDSTAPAAGRDNRFSVYTREQYVGAGKLSDFAEEEPDLANHSNLVWVAGAGAGWESQNSNANSFPGPQNSVQIAGLSAANGPGFLPGKYVLDGNIFRAAADLRAKYQGWSPFAEIFYQNINGESTPIVTGSSHTNVQQLGYFAQTGYFLAPKKLEIAARFGEVYTLDFHNHMDEYTIGVNYYLAGENAKFQLAETFIPQEAALTSGNGSLVNTEDFITQIQFQVRF